MVGPHLLLREARSGGPIAWHLALLLTTRSTASLEIFIGRTTRLHLGRSTHPGCQRLPVATIAFVAFVLVFPVQLVLRVAFLALPLVTFAFFLTLDLVAIRLFLLGFHSYSRLGYLRHRILRLQTGARVATM